MTDIKDIIWLAGLLEGEGCFMTPSKRYTLKDGTLSKRSINLTLSVRMTDLDIIEKVKKVFNTSNSIRTDKRSYNEKDIHTISIFGSVAIQWCMTIYTLMGIRRKLQIGAMIFAWNQRRFCKRGHEYKIGNTICDECRTTRRTESSRRFRARELDKKLAS